MRDTLFRSEVAETRPLQWHGKVVLLQPLSLRLISISMVLFAVATVIFASQATYTRHVSSVGSLVPDRGLIQIESPQPGIIIERRVREGQLVRAGDVLYVVSGEVMYSPGEASPTGAGATASILAQLQARAALIKSDVANASVISERERNVEKQTINSLEQELSMLDREIGIQRDRLGSKTAVYESHKQAEAQGFLSPLALQQKYDELLEYKVRLQSMQRSRFALLRELEAARSQSSTSSARTALVQAQYERQAAALEQDRVAREATNRTLVTSPEDGTIAAVLADRGQRAGTAAMLTIVPYGALLEAHVMLPSSAIGLISVGDPVTIRFDAYPHQRFGSMIGKVGAISASALPPAQQPSVERSSGDKNGHGEFRVRVILPSQDLIVSARRYPLRPGMTAELRFAQEKRTLLAWLIDPISALLDEK